MSRTASTWARIAGAVAIFVFVLWRVGADPFLDGVRAVDAWALAAAVVLAVLTTCCCAWRWKTVARRLGMDLSMADAVAAYYRSLFLNVTLPGGVVGDVHRGVSHGRDVSDVGLGLRAVVWERCAGQVVQVALTVVVLLLVPSPVQSDMPVAVVVVLVTVLGLVLATRRLRFGARSHLARISHAVVRDVRDGLLSRRAWLSIMAVSAVAVGGHAVTFLIAARTAGTTASPLRLLPLALLVMLAMALPSVGGWGPREGMTAWVFGAAGLGAAQGVATAVVYGVMVLCASLPGAVFVVTGWFRRSELSPPRWLPVVVRTDGASHG